MSFDTDDVAAAAHANASDVDAAITRASRAAAEAREQAERFRERTAARVSQQRTRP